jgi:DNA adenine methylase
MTVPQPFPYQGSKRKIAAEIVSFFPSSIETLIEPFVGSGAVSLCAASTRRAKNFWFNDINVPLMALWKDIIHEPLRLNQQYEELWTAQLGQERNFYDLIRDEFNRTHQTRHLLYLLARCVKAAVRYNANGEFNQSPDNRRKGMQPTRMKSNILAVSRLLRHRTQLTALDYREVLGRAQTSDLVYLDPPYQGVCQKQDPRYAQGILFDDFVAALHELNRRNIAFLVSYDGRTGTKTYGKILPESLNLTYIEINAGRSTQGTLLGHSQITFESLYLSPVLRDRLDDKPLQVRQLALAL